MKKLLLFIIMLLVYSGTVCAESNTIITTQIAHESSQENRVTKTENTKNQEKLIKSKLAMILVLGHATTKNGTRPYSSQN